MKENNQEIQMNIPTNETRLQWLHALMKTIFESDEAAFKKVTEDCPDYLKEYMFSDVLINLTKNKNKVQFEIVRDLSPKDYKLRMFVNTMKNCIDEKNQDAIDMLITGCRPDNIKVNMFAELLCLVIKDSNQEKINKVIDSCPDTLKKSMFARALSIGALAANQQLVEKINENWPKDKEANNEIPSKIDMLASALFALASFKHMNESTFNKAFNMLKNVCCVDKDIKEKVLSSALNLAADSTNIQKAIDMLTYVFVYDESMMANFELVKKEHYYTYTLVAKKVINESLKSINLKPNEISEALYNNSIEKNKDEVRNLTQNCPDDLKDQVFYEVLQRLCTFANTKEEVGVLIHDCSDDLINNIFFNIFIEKVLKLNEIALKSAINSCPDKLILTLLIETLMHLSENNEKKAVELLEVACSEDEDIKSAMFANALKLSALYDNNAAIDNIIEACPEGLMQTMFTYSLSSCAENKNEKAVKLIIEALPSSLLKEDILSATLFRCVIEGKEQAAQMIKDISFRNLEENSADTSLQTELIADVIFQYTLLSDFVNYNVLKSLCHEISIEEVLLRVLDKANDQENVLSTLDKMGNFFSEDSGLLETISSLQTNSVASAKKVINSISVAQNPREIINKFSSELYNKSIAKNKEVVRELTENCPDDNKKEVFSKVLKRLCSVNKKEEVGVLIHDCSDDLKWKIFIDELKENALQLNKKALKSVIHCCPDKLKLQVLVDILINLIDENQLDAKKLIEVTCPEEFKLGLFANALKIFAINNNHIAIGIIIKDCPEGLIHNMFAFALHESAIANKQKAVELIYKDEAFPSLPLSKFEILSSTLCKCIFDKNEPAGQMIKDVCISNLVENSNDSSLETNLMVDVLFKFALLYNYKKFNIVMNICSKDLREKVLSNALDKAVNIKDIKEEIDKLIKTVGKKLNLQEQHSLSNYDARSNQVLVMLSKTSEDSIKLFSDKLYGLCISKNEERVKVFTKNCPNAIKEGVFLSTLKSLCFFKNELEIGVLIHACSDDLVKYIFLNALKDYALYTIGGINNKSFETVVNTCPDKIKPYMFTQALEDIQAFMYNLVLDDVKNYMFSKPKSINELKKYILSHELNDSEKNMNQKAFDINTYQKALDVISRAYQDYKEKNTFFKALEFNNQEAVDKAIENCSEGFKPQMFREALQYFTSKKNQEAVNIIVSSIPSRELRKKVYLQVKKDFSLKRNEEAVEMIELSYKSYFIETRILKAFEDNSQEAVDKIIENESKYLNHQMFTKALQKYILENKLEVVDLIINTCPDDFKKYVYVESLKNIDQNEHKEAYDKIYNSYQNFQMLSMANVTKSRKQSLGIEAEKTPKKASKPRVTIKK